MIKSVGIDIVRTKRIEKDIEKFGERFLDKILGPNEKELADTRTDSAQFIAGRFAAKEAIIKCLGVLTDQRPAFSSLEIINNDQGQPILEAGGELAQLLAPYSIHLSISHEKKYAAAVAVLEERNEPAGTA